MGEQNPEMFRVMGRDPVGTRAANALMRNGIHTLQELHEALNDPYCPLLVEDLRHVGVVTWGRITERAEKKEER